MSKLKTSNKETSQRRKDASRANGAKSRGPVTPEGKARTSQNAATHRLLCVNVRTEEDQIKVNGMMQGYLAHFQPRDQPEYDLVVRAVVATYLLFECQNRAITILNIQMAKDRHTINAGWRNATDEDREAFAFIAAVDGSNALDRTERYARNHAAQADRAVKMLLELQKRPLPPGTCYRPGDPAGQPDVNLRNKPSPINGHSGAQVETPPKTAHEPVEAVDYEPPKAPPGIVERAVQVPALPALCKSEYAQPVGIESALPPASAAPPSAEKWMVCGG